MQPDQQRDAVGTQPGAEQVIRERFHEWMERAGFRPMPIPKPGRSYPGSHIETLWEAYLDATLRERNGRHE